MKVKRITEDQVKAWVGSDHLNATELIELLTEIINGEYSVAEFQADVSAYGEDE